MVQAARAAPWWPMLPDALPPAGQTGTLAGRMRGTAAEDNVHAKTGTIIGGAALTGNGTTAGGRAFVFSRGRERARRRSERGARSTPSSPPSPAPPPEPISPPSQFLSPPRRPSPRPSAPGLLRPLGVRASSARWAPDGRRGRRRRQQTRRSPATPTRRRSSTRSTAVGCAGWPAVVTGYGDTIPIATATRTPRPAATHRRAPREPVRGNADQRGKQPAFRRRSCTEQRAVSHRDRPCRCRWFQRRAGCTAHGVHLGHDTEPRHRGVVIERSPTSSALTGRADARQRRGVAARDGIEYCHRRVTLERACAAERLVEEHADGIQIAHR